ncbi:mechanosensitive ion channel family protein [Psychroflexus sp. YR1-1]|uniref:Mechanosensitive ion channel family protein n=1 Tax=Psychroflexus aurantiacus TaxID=2709310 RepID=A0A6B3R4X3_9FLAO|nr:mechanosensitive ion channel family protein [Psychroflexus aurantiacus]NEV94620.1 mechanosensitive ion channel family protein [Psychroflexus aurantiacus]
MRNPTTFYKDIIQYFETNYIHLGLTLLFLIAGFLIANFIKKRVRLRLIKKSPNHITATFISQIISFALKTAVLLITLYMLGLDAFTNKILAGAGLLTFVIGFALKDIGENFLAGIILAFKSPFRLNDLIEVDKIVGFVKDINIRETLIKTPDGRDVFLPNSIILKNPLFNYTIDGFLRYEFTVGIAYENSPGKASEIIEETLSKLDSVLKGDKKPSIAIDEFATNTVNLKVRFWINTFESTKRSYHINIRSNAMDKVMGALLSAGFSLPASIVELKNYDQSDSLNLKLNSDENSL